MHAALLFRSISLFLFASLMACSAVLAQERRGVTIPFPRGGSASVGLVHGPLLIRSVTLKNRPSVSEIRRALRSDRKDTKLLAWVFQVANAGRRDWHARIVVNVLDREGLVLASNDRTAEIDARDFHDRITVFTRIRTVNYARADRAQIQANFFRY
jgi:hypothetical protein